MLTERRCSSGDNDTTIDSLVAATRPTRPPDSLEWLSDDVLDTICKCMSPSWGSRPDLNVVTEALDEAGDAAELRSRGIKEENVIHLLKNYKGGHGDAQKAEAQRMVDLLGSVSRSGNLGSKVD